jgi:hypothetical protein
MCHHVYVTLSAEEKKEAKKFAGIMIPVYASIVLAVVALVALTGAPRQGEQVATTSAPAATR